MEVPRLPQSACARRIRKSDQNLYIRVFTFRVSACPGSSVVTMVAVQPLVVSRGGAATGCECVCALVDGLVGPYGERPV